MALNKRVAIYAGTFDPMMVSALHKALPRVLPVRLEARNGVTEVLPVKYK